LRGPTSKGKGGKEREGRGRDLLRRGGEGREKEGNGWRRDLP